MIARLSFRFGGKRVRAMVTDERQWLCEDKRMEDILNILFDPKRDGPATGFPGACAARAASFFMDGHATFPARKPDLEEVVY